MTSGLAVSTAGRGARLAATRRTAQVLLLWRRFYLVSVGGIDRVEFSPLTTPGHTAGQACRTATAANAAAITYGS